MKLKFNNTQKQKFSQTLKSWFPILKANICDLEKDLCEYVSDNPFVEIKSGFEKEYGTIFNKKSIYSNRVVSNSRTDSIEALTLEKPSVYDRLSEQITPPLFPTQLSQDIANEIIFFINDEGYFEGDIQKIADKFNQTPEAIEKIRARFAYIDPVGVGAIDVRESFLFQLEHAQIDDDVYAITVEIINNFDDIINFKNHPHYREAVHTIKTFRNPPLIDFAPSDDHVIPDIMIYIGEDNQIEVELNSDYYPTITIDAGGMEDNQYVKAKMKEAKNLVDALDMRKATLYKIGLEIVEYQYEYFMGGDLKPLKLQDIADEFGHNSSTISRAIANKYIECNRGIIPMKNFFSTALDEDISNNSIKEYLMELIKQENRQKPLSDNKIVELIDKKFNLKIGRRTVTKYRLQLGIESSSERKKSYQLIID